jgi:hypothetical protein
MKFCRMTLLVSLNKCVKDKIKVYAWLCLVGRCDTKHKDTQYK